MCSFQHCTFSYHPHSIHSHHATQSYSHSNRLYHIILIQSYQRIYSIQSIQPILSIAITQSIPITQSIANSQSNRSDLDSGKICIIIQVSVLNLVSEIVNNLIAIRVSSLTYFTETGLAKIEIGLILKQSK